MVYQPGIRVGELSYCRDSAPCFICQKNNPAPQPAIRVVVGSKVQAERLAGIYRDAGLTVEIGYYAHRPTKVDVIASACVHHIEDLGRLKDTIEAGENIVTDQQMHSLETRINESKLGQH